MIWTPELPINNLPEEIKLYYINDAEYLLNELETNRLNIVLVAASEPRYEDHMVRIVESQNPEWYSSLYNSIGHFRRDRSLNALNRIVSQTDKALNFHLYKYDYIYRNLIHERLTEGFLYQNYKIPPNETIKSFFRL